MAYMVLRKTLERNLSQVGRAVVFTDNAKAPPPEPSPEKYDALERALGHTFTNRYLLRLSLVQASAAQHTNNRQLAWLGDAVLLMIRTQQLLMTREDSAALGTLAAARDVALSRQHLYACAKKLELEQYMVQSTSQKASGAPHNNMMAETFEALLGAVYLDGGLEAVTTLLTDKFPLPAHAHKKDLPGSTKV